jgi:hypothetical protein
LAPSPSTRTRHFRVGVNDCGDDVSAGLAQHRLYGIRASSKRWASKVPPFTSPMA